MRRLFILALPVALLFSCAPNSTKLNTPDYFRFIKAVDDNKLDYVKANIDKFDVNSSWLGLMPIHWVKSTEMLDLLLRHNADVNPDKTYADVVYGPLYAASGKDLVDVDRDLLDHGADINAVNKFTGETALHNAVRLSCSEAVEFLLKNHINRNIRDKDGKTALDYAKELNKPDIVKMFPAN